MSSGNSSITYPPFFEITDIDHGPWVVVVAFCSISLITLIAAIRFILAGRLKLKFELDDAAFAMATALAIANALCMYRAVVAGLGRHISDLGDSGLMTYYKLMYAAQILGILSQGFAKVSVVMLFRRIAPATKQLHFIFLGCIAFWVFISTFMIAFQCQLPSPWIYVPDQCSTHGTLQYPVIVLNMVTDIMLSAGILPTVWKLHTTRSTRMAVIMLFASRFIVVLLSVGLLVSVALSVTDPDQTWASLPRAAWDIMVILLSAITATIPRTNTFWVSLQTGKAGADVTEYELSGSRSAGNNTFATHHTKNTLTAKSQSSTTSASEIHGQNDEPGLRSQNAHLRLVPGSKNKVSTKIFAAERELGSDETELVPARAPTGGLEDDDKSQKSLVRPGQSLGIYRNTEVSVAVEHVYHRNV